MAVRERLARGDMWRSRTGVATGIAVVGVLATVYTIGHHERLVLIVVLILSVAIALSTRPFFRSMPSHMKDNFWAQVPMSIVPSGLRCSWSLPCGL